MTFVLCHYMILRGYVSESENETVASMADTCPSLAECTLMCVNGYVQTNGCYVCQCAQADHGQFGQFVVSPVYVLNCLHHNIIIARR